jgi:hypothetical protein
LLASALVRAAIAQANSAKDRVGTAPQIAKVRHRHKRDVRRRILWHKLLYGWVAKHRDFVKKK